MPQVILYDLPRKGRCACWSYNPWKTRLALNFKNIDYKTEWLEYPEVEPTLKPYVKPNPPGNTQYTIPTCQFPNGEYIMDSKKIAQRLEIEHPVPSLHLDSPILAVVEKLFPKVHEPLRSVCVPLVPNILNETSRNYFHQTRAERFGKPLPQLLKEEGGEEAWMAAIPGLKEFGQIVMANGGPYVMGKIPSYADFVIVSWLHFMKTIKSDNYQRLIKIEPALGTLYNECQQWLERDDY